MPDYIEYNIYSCRNILNLYDCEWIAQQVKAIILQLFSTCLLSDADCGTYQ